MKNFCWKYFKKTGNIEAVMYIIASKGFHFENEQIREIKDTHAYKYRWNSFEIDKI
ncbi:hypothetical protein [Tepidibacter formicigenes]|jgi:hypothetical protein|uniref:YqzL-like protein n=1 Tax=Tepidibacter formicigenes DSM 15518 TaxID=1123349 RepID=A0A1M6TA16_9FIRM|nr:hypothetical protein [Tepidibacter formicigenes]SHK53734.1 hypothetical protein SAMN02744037_02549 [Tepidibacter formicigenes DSM 15518]